MLESKNLGFITSHWSGSKQDLRDELRSRPDGERLWQTLQGRVYGPNMEQAVMFPGVALFLMRSRQRGDEVFIVSHKTEFGHFDPTSTPLRQAALAWMESKRFFDQRRFGISKGNVFFAGTRTEKVQQIARLNLDIFVDDLEEVFSEEGFNKKAYRKFNINQDEVKSSDDYGMMSHVLNRRFSKEAINDQKKHNNLPEVILIDGGKGHYDLVKKILNEKNLKDIKIISIYKGEGRKSTLDQIIYNDQKGFIKKEEFFISSSPIIIK